MLRMLRLGNPLGGLGIFAATASSSLARPYPCARALGWAAAAAPSGRSVRVTSLAPQGRVAGRSQRQIRTERDCSRGMRCDRFSFAQPRLPSLVKQLVADSNAMPLEQLRR